MKFNGDTNYKTALVRVQCTVFSMEYVYHNVKQVSILIHTVCECMHVCMSCCILYIPNTWLHTIYVHNYVHNNYVDTAKPV